MFKALLVDNHLNFRTALYEALHARFPFCELVAVDDVASALQQAVSMRPDLVIADLALADGSGFELIRRLRQMAVTAPIAVLTIHELPEYREEALRSGADDFFGKLSTSVQHLFDYVEALLAKRLRTLVICAEPRLGDAIGSLLAAGWPDMVSVRTAGLEDGVRSARLLKPQLVVFDSEDDAERERVFCQALRIDGAPPVSLVCVRNGPVATAPPAGADEVLSRAGDFEVELAHIVERVRADHFPQPLAA
jgi:CheY-like chemotaxis protein